MLLRTCHKQFSFFVNKMQACVNLMRFIKVLYLNYSVPKYVYRVGEELLENSTGEKGWGVLGHEGLDVANVHLQPGRQGVLWVVSEGRWPAEREVTVPSLLCSCDTLPAILCLGPGRDLYGITEGRWREVGFSVWRRLCGGLVMAFQYLKGAYQLEWDIFLHW